MAESSQRLGFFHWLRNQTLCCCKVYSAETIEVGRALPTDDSIGEAKQGKFVAICPGDVICETSYINKEPIKCKKHSPVTDTDILAKGVDSSPISAAVEEQNTVEIVMADGADQMHMTRGDMGIPEDRSHEVRSLMNSLSYLECPFSWKPDEEGADLKDGCWMSNENERTGSLLIEYLSTKDSEFCQVQNTFFRSLCIYLVLSYEKALLGQMASSVVDIYQCQLLVNKAESDSNCIEAFLVQNGRKDGINYVLLASIAHIKFLQGSYSSSWDTVHSVKEKYSNLCPEARAIVHGLHAGVLMEYGYRGNKMALGPARTALNLDPDCWLWSLFIGKLLGRYRRKTLFHLPPSREEIISLQRAAEIHPESECLSHLADVYKHLNSVIIRQGYTPSYISELLTAEEINSLPLLARDLYIKAASKEPNCPYINARSAKGLLSLPMPFKELDLAEKYIVRALHLAPNDSLVNHYAGYYYESRKEFEQALESYRRALSLSGGSLSGPRKGVGNYPAELCYLALQHRLQTGQQEWAGTSTQVGGGGVRGGRFSIARGMGNVGCVAQGSPLFHLDAIYTKYKSKTHRMQTLCNKGYYLLMYEKDVHGALRAFAAAIRMDPESILLKKFWSVFRSSNASQPYEPVNVYRLVKEEVETILSASPTAGNVTYLQGLLDLVREKEDVTAQE